MGKTIWKASGLLVVITVVIWGGITFLPGNLGGVATPKANLVNVYGSSTNDETLTTSTDPVVFTLEIGEGIDFVRTNTAYLASSTNSRIEFSIGYSWDGSNFFGEAGGFHNNTTSVDTLLLNTATSSYIIAPSGTEREYRSFEIPTNGARYLQYSIGRAGPGAAQPSNAEMWVQAALIDNR